MAQAGGQSELEARMIRPHLSAGDALLFDCRILHFGVANQSDFISLPRSSKPKDVFKVASNASLIRAQLTRQENVENLLGQIDISPLTSNAPSPCIRPILYVNYTHQWFQGIFLVSNLTNNFAVACHI